MWIKGDGQPVRLEPEIRYVDREVPVVRLVEKPVHDKYALLLAFAAGMVFQWLTFSIFIKLI